MAIYPRGSIQDILSRYEKLIAKKGEVTTEHLWGLLRDMIQIFDDRLKALENPEDRASKSLEG